jgi:hydrogenase maturation protein HypF
VIDCSETASVGPFHWFANCVKKTANINARVRVKLAIRGAVQGVGFRPFVHRLATSLNLAGWVNNSPQGVFIEVEGSRETLETFLLRLETERPPHSFIQSLESSWLDPAGFTNFEIRASDTSGSKSVLVMPDIATCPDCLREIFDSRNRRYRYPFTNCTNCGPRFSIIESLPYDRANTSMKGFAMCPACQTEHDDPANRRFHAQPNACPVCGPRLEFWEGGAGVPPAPGRRDACATSLHREHAALLAAAEAIRRGQIVAVKGIGGFHLMVDAHNEDAVRRLRERKHREEKPLALMFPSLNSVKAVCEVSPQEERLLRSPEAPIVLLGRLSRPHPSPLPQEKEQRSPLSGKSGSAGCLTMSKQSMAHDCCSLSPGERARVRAGVEHTHFEIAASVAPANPNLGVMLPSNPLHHLLMAELGFPVVATSGNLSDEPICTDEREALERLAGIADDFLVHDRPIVRHVDDSIVRMMLDREMVLRRARGYAPLPVTLRSQPSTINHQPILAVGAHLKNTVALAVGPQVFISQHIGDLETEQARAAFHRVIADLEKLYDVAPQIIATDLHPDYLSTKYANDQFRSSGFSRSEPPKDGTPNEGSQAGRLSYVGVQHHIAHVLSCMAENELQPPVLGVAWDGTGYGTDGTLWGGEFFLVTDTDVKRIAHLRRFRLPGGDAAAKEPRRAAFGLLHELADGDDEPLLHMQQKFAGMFSPAELATLDTMLARNINTPLTSSAGRLFDAVAALIGLRQRMHFEGQAAMELEFALDGVETDESYPIELRGSDQNELETVATTVLLDWSPMIKAILADIARGLPVGLISAKFHNALAESIVVVAKQARRERVVLSGGCFQNRYLTERAVRRLREEAFQPYWHQRVPPNDGGIALGQIIAVQRSRREIVNRKS